MKTWQAFNDHLRCTYKSLLIFINWRQKTSTISEQPGGLCFVPSTLKPTNNVEI
ncbi:hypothetical protein M23134_02618 [Microscilla marina ATCC 23134]|uniref:Uncharacterized protein n=1 Tax=Microscilla marina ATCC 23134 TaxID=313606 RepID=A1ZNR0_MICM2|nr:hypothetical protein M23134_02618 [Microscilla marina ATCC 23134]